MNRTGARVAGARRSELLPCFRGLLGGPTWKLHLLRFKQSDRLILCLSHSFLAGLFYSCSATKTLEAERKPHIWRSGAAGRLLRERPLRRAGVNAPSASAVAAAEVGALPYEAKPEQRRRAQA